MLPALLSLVALTLPAPVQADGPPAEAVREALDELKAARKLGSEEKVLVIGRHASLADASVVDAIADHFRDKDPEVRRAILQALRYQPHPSALEELHKIAKRERKIDETPEVHEALLHAIGQHADPSSLSILAKDPFDGRADEVVRTRIYAIGRIRTTKSVEVLMNAMHKAGDKTTNRWMGDLRVSLMVLTGTDRGRSKDRWTAWWNDNKRTLEVSPKLPKLPERDAVRWKRFWGEDYERSRPARREDRGRRE